MRAGGEILRERWPFLVERLLHQTVKKRVGDDPASDMSGPTREKAGCCRTSAAARSEGAKAMRHAAEEHLP